MVQFENLPPQGKEIDDEEVERDTNSISSGQNTPNGTLKKSEVGEGQGSKKRKRKPKPERGLKINGTHPHSKRRHSVSKPARDPRDEAPPQRLVKDDARTRSPSRVIDFDGLSCPSRSPDLLHGIIANFSRSRYS
jgi:GTP cyclohydrolase I